MQAANIWSVSTTPSPLGSIQHSCVLLDVGKISLPGGAAGHASEERGALLDCSFGLPDKANALSAPQRTVHGNMLCCCCCCCIRQGCIMTDLPLMPQNGATNQGNNQYKATNCRQMGRHRYIMRSTRLCYRVTTEYLMMSIRLIVSWLAFKRQPAGVAALKHAHLTLARRNRRSSAPPCLALAAALGTRSAVFVSHPLSPRSRRRTWLPCVMQWSPESNL
jgi:hypothetical protein